jgi:hypothetical protein
MSNNTNGKGCYKQNNVSFKRTKLGNEYKKKNVIDNIIKTDKIKNSRLNYEKDNLKSHIFNNNVSKVIHEKTIYDLKSQKVIHNIISNILNDKCIEGEITIDDASGNLDTTLPTLKCLVITNIIKFLFEIIDYKKTLNFDISLEHYTIMFIIDKLFLYKIKEDDNRYKILRYICFRISSSLQVYLNPTTASASTTKICIPEANIIYSETELDIIIILIMKPISKLTGKKINNNILKNTVSKFKTTKSTNNILYGINRLTIIFNYYTNHYYIKMLKSLLINIYNLIDTNSNTPISMKFLKINNYDAIFVIRFYDYIFEGFDKLGNKGDINSVIGNFDEYISDVPPPPPPTSSTTTSVPPTSVPSPTTPVPPLPPPLTSTTTIP